jgi:uncharacterized protein YndB with AHSA1/START domain
MDETIPDVAEGIAPGDSAVAPEGDVYRLGYRWLINGPVDVVFDVLLNVNNHPTWWPAFKSVESDSTEVAVGTRARMRLRGRMPYTIVWDTTYVQVDRPRYIEMDTAIVFSNRFPMSGPVRCTLSEGPDGVEVVNEQNVYTKRRLPRPLRNLMQRAFDADYNWSFSHAGPGLQKAVDEVLAAREKMASAS